MTTSSANIVQLHDQRSGSTARIAVGLGFNCFSFRVRFDDEEMEALWSSPAFERGTDRPSGSGIPILFPFPSRIAGGVVKWGGKKYALEPSDGRGNAIHGFVYTRPWRIEACEESRVVGCFQASVDDPSVLGFWPADFKITAEYRLQGRSLRGSFHLENPDSKPLPCGFGTHPYFRVPLGGEDAGDCAVSLPVTHEWELVDLIPTGDRLPLRDAESFQRGLLFGDMQFDNAFGGLQADQQGVIRSSIHDPASLRTLTLTFDNTFRELVVYTPGHREAVCIEPYTCVPNAVELYGEGIDSGLRVLNPGESLTTWMEIEVAEGEPRSNAASPK
jgi:aldose 1-epimerase